MASPQRKPAAAASASHSIIAKEAMTNAMRDSHKENAAALPPPAANSNIVAPPNSNSAAAPKLGLTSWWSALFGSKPAAGMPRIRIININMDESTKLCS